MGSRCEVGTRMETPHGSIGRKPLVWGCHVFCCFPVEARETSRTGLPFVGVYTYMHLRMYIHGCICMRGCGWGLSEDIWISRASRVKKRAQDRYSEMDVYTEIGSGQGHERTIYQWHQVCDIWMTPTKSELLALENLELLRFRPTQQRPKKELFEYYMYISWRLCIHIHWWDPYSWQCAIRSPSRKE